jgi:hypothetical protein
MRDFELETRLKGRRFAIEDKQKRFGIRYSVQRLEFAEDARPITAQVGEVAVRQNQTQTRIPIFA